MSEPQPPETKKPKDVELSYDLVVLLHNMRISRKFRHGFIHGFVNALLFEFFSEEHFMIGHPSHSSLYMDSDPDPLDHVEEVRAVVVFQRSSRDSQYGRVVLLVVAKAEPQALQLAIEETKYYLDHLGERLSSDGCKVHGIAVACDRVAILVPGEDFKYKLMEQGQDMRVDHTSFLNYLSERASIAPFE